MMSDDVSTFLHYRTDRSMLRLCALLWILKLHRADYKRRLQLLQQQSVPLNSAECDFLQVPTTPAMVPSHISPSLTIPQLCSRTTQLPDVEMTARVHHTYSSDQANTGNVGVVGSPSHPSAVDYDTSMSTCCSEQNQTGNDGDVRLMSHPSDVDLDTNVLIHASYAAALEIETVGDLRSLVANVGCY